jgi:hypothetical protein
MQEKTPTVSATDSLAREEAVHKRPASALESSAADPSLTPDRALALLKHAELPAAAIESVAENVSLIKQRKVRLALIAHPRAPRHLWLRLLRHVYTFDLMRLALTPSAPMDVKRAAEEVLLTRLGTIPAGEKLSLARRASGRVAQQLLLENDSRVLDAALQNPRLTESSIVKVLGRPEATPAFVYAVCHHAQWSQRRDVRIALLRHQKTPLAKALEFAQRLSPSMLQEVLKNSKLPLPIKNCVLNSRQAAGRASYTFP